ncbi:MAG TPA: chromate transporter [Anaerolineales bacterium]
MILLELFIYFAIISMLAFGGGNAVISLLERISVDQMRWITPQDFAAAVGFAYITPGPVLITSAFIGHRAAGFLGAIVATVGVFLIPWSLSVMAAYQVRRYIQHPWLQGFGLGAGPAVIGLLGVTVWTLGGYAFLGWLYGIISGVALVLALFTKVSPILILIGGTALGVLAGPLLTN